MQLKPYHVIIFYPQTPTNLGIAIDLLHEGIGHSALEASNRHGGMFLQVPVQASRTRHDMKAKVHPLLIPSLAITKVPTQLIEDVLWMRLLRSESSQVSTESLSVQWHTLIHWGMFTGGDQIHCYLYRCSCTCVVLWLMKTFVVETSYH